MLDQTTLDGLDPQKFNNDFSVPLPIVSKGLTCCLILHKPLVRDSIQLAMDRLDIAMEFAIAK